MFVALSFSVLLFYLLFCDFAAFHIIQFLIWSMRAEPDIFRHSNNNCTSFLVTYFDIYITIFLLDHCHVRCHTKLHKKENCTYIDWLDLSGSGVHLLCNIPEHISCQNLKFWKEVLTVTTTSIQSNPAPIAFISKCFSPWKKKKQRIQNPKIRLSGCSLYFMLPVKLVALLPGATKRKNVRNSAMGLT